MGPKLKDRSARRVSTLTIAFYLVITPRPSSVFPYHAEASKGPMNRPENQKRRAYSQLPSHSVVLKMTVQRLTE
jgi:hypothetical protein